VDYYRWKNLTGLVKRSFSKISVKRTLLSSTGIQNNKYN